MTHYTYEPLPCSVRSVTGRLVELARAGCTTTLPLKERLAVALVLDRADWLTEMGHSMLDATQHLDSVWLQACRQAQRTLRRRA